jgi:hypothetical protein
MRRVAVACVLLMGIVVAASPARALSIGLADVYHPSYGQARHYSQAFERLGASGTTYDGVQYTHEVVPGNVLDLSVTAAVSSPVGEYEWMGIWIDWDLDRVWEPSERVVYLHDYWFDHGQTTLNWGLTVPTWASLGTTWMRVRYTYDGPVSATGDLYTGEVEDYQVRFREAGGTPPVPEPASLLLLGMGAVVLGVASLRGRRGVSKRP